MLSKTRVLAHVYRLFDRELRNPRGPLGCRNRGYCFFRCGINGGKWVIPRRVGRGDFGAGRLKSARAIFYLRLRARLRVGIERGCSHSGGVPRLRSFFSYPERGRESRRALTLMNRSLAMDKCFLREMGREDIVSDKKFIFEFVVVYLLISVLSGINHLQFDIL